MLIINQWWHGAAADFVKIPRVSISRAAVWRKELVGVEGNRRAPRRRTLDPKDCARK